MQDRLPKSHPPLVVHARTVTGTGGGPEKTIIQSPRFLRELGFQSKCLFIRPPKDLGFDVLRGRAKEADAELIEIDDVGKFSPRMVRQVIKHSIEQNVDIWHAHDYKSNLLGLIVSRYHPMQLITTAHGWVNFDGFTPFYYWLDKKFFLPRYEKVVCVSSTVLEQAVAGGTPASQCIVIDNAINHEAFTRQRTIASAKYQDYGIDQDVLLIGSIGRLSPEKGFDLLIDAVTKVRNEGLNVKLVIGGEGPEKENLQHQIDSAGMQNHVNLIGFCRDTRSFYEALDLFVLSSHREGLPNVVLEAMSVGTAVIATNIDGVPRVITNGFDGLLISPGSADQIAASISQLASNPKGRSVLSESAIKTIRKKWSFLHRMQKVIELYRV